MIDLHYQYGRNPVIVQGGKSREVLKSTWTDAESVRQTQRTGYAHSLQPEQKKDRPTRGRKRPLPTYHPDQNRL